MRRTGFLTRGAFLLASGVLLAWGTRAWAVMCTVNAPPILSITADVGPFTLTFSSFLAGSLSSIQTVVYRVQANNMAAGSFSGAVTAHLQELFEDVELRADVTGYSNLGEPGFSSLSESQGGFVALQTTPVSLADKEPGDACCDPCLDGMLNVSWQARLTKDAAAGTSARALTVTLKDGF